MHINFHLYIKMMEKQPQKENPGSKSLIMVTGGQRSGKSLFAEKLALSISCSPYYIATATIQDEEMARRVALHQERRGEIWKNIEAPLNIEAIDLEEGSTVLIDCLTLLATNWFFELGEKPEAAYQEVVRQLDNFLRRNIRVIIVTNEIGLGGVSMNALQRMFTDLQGKLNQYVASNADEVYLIISGIPVKIK